MTIGGVSSGVTNAAGGVHRCATSQTPTPACAATDKAIPAHIHGGRGAAFVDRAQTGVAGPPAVFIIIMAATPSEK
jgi:hypothetical protein